jgi:serine/threonine protein kinase
VSILEQFRPAIGMQLCIGGKYFDFVPHPLFPGDDEMVFAIEGGEAFTYQVCAAITKRLYALKVMKPVYRGEHIARVVEMVKRSARVPGFYLPDRVCLTKTSHPDLIEAHPELEYAVFMPWLGGQTWSELMQNQRASASYTLEQACALATAVAKLLRNLESMHVAHSDIAGANVLLSADLRRVQLLDLEGVYIPNLPASPFRSRGSPGYQHGHLGSEGQWCPKGDRFAGAILLAEMLTWWNPYVRAHVTDNAERLFQPAELQTDSSPCWSEVRDTLWSMHPDLLALFDQAWFSASLDECPEFNVWYGVLVSYLEKDAFLR